MNSAETISAEGWAVQREEASGPPPLTPETVNTAVAWYRRNKARISGHTINTPGVKFGERWAEETLEPAIARWEAGAMGLTLAGAYVVNKLRIIRSALNQ